MEGDFRVNVGLYLLGEKGFVVLCELLKSFNSQNISFICIGTDKNIAIDYFEEIKKLCIEKRIDWFRRQDILNIKADYTFAVGWRWIINDSENLIVLHDSLLPKYRGFAPLVNMLINGEERIGVTALMASSEYDCGKIINQKSIEISYPITIQQAIEIISPLYAEVVCLICRNLKESIVLNAFVQDESLATYSLWRDESDYDIDWNLTSEQIIRFINAVSYPYAGASTYYKNNKIRIMSATKIDNVYVIDRKQHVGKCIFKRKNKLVIICGEGLVQLNEVFESNTSLLFESFSFRTRLTSDPQRNINGTL